MLSTQGRVKEGVGESERGAPCVWWGCLQHRRLVEVIQPEGADPTLPSHECSADQQTEVSRAQVCSARRSLVGEAPLGPGL